MYTYIYIFIHMPSVKYKYICTPVKTEVKEASLLSQLHKDFFFFLFSFFLRGRKQILLPKIGSVLFIILRW